VLSQAVAPPPAPVAARLDLDPAEPAVEIVRLRSVGGEPLLLETSWVPWAACPGLEGEDLARRSLYDLLEGRYGHRLAKPGRRSRRRRRATGRAAPRCRGGSPVLLVEAWR
jgi:GntR family transcriptional regulator